MRIINDNMSDKNQTPVILVLGARGNLGSQIVQELNNKNIGRVLAWTHKDCDVTDMYTLETSIKNAKPSIVINTVAYNDVDACEKNLEEQKKAIILNVEVVECLARICHEINAKFVHFSTNYVFSGLKETYTEYDTTDPINFYGLTKRMGEEIILRRLELGLTGSIIRVSNLFGPKGFSESSKPSFFDAILKASEKKKILEVIDDEVCCFTYSKDIAKAVVARLQSENFKGIFHFVNSEPTTWYKAAKIYFELLEKKIEICPITGDVFPREAKRPKSAILETTKTAPMRSFSEAMLEFLRS